MIVSIMQPYFWPYIGYFQLISASDIFIIYDDCQYRKNSWINRNRIINQSTQLSQYITLPIEKHSIKNKINDIKLSINVKCHKQKILKSINQNYSNSISFNKIYPIIKESLLYDSSLIYLFLANSIKDICNILNIKTKIISSSKLNYNRHGNAQDKVIDLISNVGGSEYINPINGHKLYSIEKFKQHNISLKFLKINDIFYYQSVEKFINNLSIIDVLMFNEDKEVNKLLTSYTLT